MISHFRIKILCKYYLNSLFELNVQFKVQHHSFCRGIVDLVDIRVWQQFLLCSKWQYRHHVLPMQQNGVTTQRWQSDRGFFYQHFIYKC